MHDWDKHLVSLGFKNAQLVSISPFNAHDTLRVYSKGNIIIKIYLLTPDNLTLSNRKQTIEGEFHILKICSAIPGIPKIHSFKRTTSAKAFTQQRINGINLSTFIGKRGYIPLKHLLFDVPILLLRLSMKGISHNDIVPRNVLVTEAGQLFLIDFDQAEKTTIFDAFLRNIGLIKRGTVSNSLITLIKDSLKTYLGHTRTNKLKRLLGKSTNNFQEIPQIPNDAPDRLQKLHMAWQIAKDSYASSPGQPTAYYSLKEGNFFFPGERPWEQRWSVLRTITDYSNKRIIEIGCNMSLLSCSLLHDENAEAVLAIDMDAEIIQAAEYVSSAYNVKPKFLKIDLDSTDNWEEMLRSFSADLVFALNIFNWIKKKDRFLNFLSEFPEIIFEGHDSFTIEKSRLKSVGFTDIHLVALTERQRPLMYCRK